MRKRFAGAAMCAAMILVPAGTAIAGEITGNGKPTGMAGNARSACGFSGLEDNPEALDHPGNTKPGRLTQTPHYVYFDLVPEPFFLNPPPGAPGQPGGCNPNTATPE